MIKEISFENIEDVWLQKDMWGDALQKKMLMTAAPVHSIYYWDGKEYFGGFDEKIRDLSYSNPVYYAWIEDGEIVGVNSYYHLNSIQCRSRGLYVFPEYRGKGIGRKLLEHAIESNRKSGYKFIWSLPRQTSKSTYESAGFIITSDDFLDMPDGTGNLFYENAYCRYNYV
jgi:GNAT superfamily N-acetyltransferase